MRHIKEYNQLFESTQELTREQKNWLNKCTDGTWEINPQTGLIDVYGDFECKEQGLPDFKGVRFGKVTLSFNCSDNSLTSLTGAPQSVGKFFNCSDNSLTSLDGAPREVGGSINCFNNPITEWVIEGILREMSNEGITLEQAVERLWNEIPEEDGTYLAKHHPNLPPEEKREYEALERHKKRLI